MHQSDSLRSKPSKTGDHKVEDCASSHEMKTDMTINVSTALVLFVSQAYDSGFDFVLTICCAIVCSPCRLHMRFEDMDLWISCDRCLFGDVFQILS